jgi:acyl-CoA thioester hydrolase
MSIEETEAEGVYRHRLVVSGKEIDQNGHVNNVAYIQWMQEVAIRHSEETGGTLAMRAAGGTWVVRSHEIEYLSPAYAGNEIEVVTWVASLQRVRSLRKYRFVRVNDGTLLAKGQTEWVFVGARDGRPRGIPAEVRNAFKLLPDYETGASSHSRRKMSRL